MNEEILRLIDRGELVAYFGYGSLVNRATLRTPVVHAVPARLRGWRRTWRPRPDMPGFPAALLSVEANRAAGCDGLLIFERRKNLAHVDVREARYRRREIGAEDLLSAESLPRRVPIYVYEAERDVPPHREPPRILRSYLDAVMQGFLREHGEAGLYRFVEETAGFDMPLHEDRERPLYPRAVSVTVAERGLFDDALASIGKAPASLPNGGLAG